MARHGSGGTGRGAGDLWLGVGLSVALALWLSHGVWGGVPAADDAMALLVREEFGARLLRGGRLDGWFPAFGLGYQRYLLYGPGASWLIGAVDVLGGAAVSTGAALTAVAVASYAALGPALAFLARSIGLTTRAAGLAAVLAVAVDSPFGIGLAGTFRIGLVAQQVGAVLLLLVLGAGVRVLGGGGRRWWCFATLGLAALVLTHPVSLALLLVAGVLLVAPPLLWERPPLRHVARVALAGAAAAGLAAFWLVPYVGHRSLAGPTTGLAVPALGSRVGELLRGEVLFPSLLTVAALAAAWWCLVVGVADRRRRRLVPVALAAPSYLVVAHLVEDRWSNGVTLYLPTRGLALAGLLAVLPLAHVAGELAGWLRGRLAGPPPARRVRAPAVTAAGLAALAAVTAVTWWAAPDRSAATRHGAPAPELAAAARELARRVPDGARFATERDFPGEIERLGVVHPDFWLAHASRRWTLNQFGVELSAAPEAGAEAERIGKVAPEQSARALERYGVTHVVSVRADTAAMLAGSGWFETVWQGPTTSVLAVRPPRGADPGDLLSPEGGIDLRAELVRAGAERLTWEVTTTGPGTATAAVAWSPKWRLRIDDETLALERTADGLLRLPLRGGTQRVELHFGPDGWDRVGLGVSALTLTGLVLAQSPVSLMSRRRSRTA